MKKLVCFAFVLILVIALIPSYVFAYDGGPLGDTTTSYYGDVIFTEDNTEEVEIIYFDDAFDITKDPVGEKKKAGQEVAFTADAIGYDSVRWYCITPNGKTHLATDVPNLYKGVSVGGTTTKRLTLYNITSDISGCRFYAAFTGGDITMNTAAATLTVEGTAATPTPTAAPTPTTAPTPTPVASTHVQSGGTNNGGTQQGTVYVNGNTSMMGTQSYNSDVSIGNAGAASEPSANATNTSANGNTVIENTRGSSHVGAYILATVAGLVIIGSILIMVLYMKGKISLGKFEKFLGNSQTKDPDMFDENEFYNPDNFNDTMDV